MTALPREVALIERLAAALPRSPRQRNARHESDAELIALPGTDAILALTTDAIVEEIEAGLYADPYLIGWMTVMANASDLAAVGAEPLGILVSETLPPDLDASALARLQEGIREASEAAALPVLGGDTNTGTQLQMAACAVGLVADGQALTRRGARPGDRLFGSGPLGLGSAFALRQWADGRDPRAPAGPPLSYRPRARLREGQCVRRIASCAMDTSDGPLATLDELMRINRVGFVLERPVEEILEPAALRAAEAAALPPWTMLAGPHGEFELLFTVPADRVGELWAAARSQGWAPLDLGAVVEEPGLRLLAGTRMTALDTRQVRDRFPSSQQDLERYIADLLRAAS